MAAFYLFRLKLFHKINDLVYFCKHSWVGSGFNSSLIIYIKLLITLSSYFKSVTPTV